MKGNDLEPAAYEAFRSHRQSLGHSPQEIAKAWEAEQNRSRKTRSGRPRNPPGFIIGTVDGKRVLKRL